MKTLIVYATKHGCAERCATLLAAHFQGNVRLHNLMAGDIDPTGYDTVIIGSSFYVGQAMKPVTEFCAKYKATLLGKRLGLFAVCMKQGQEATAQMDTAFGQELTAHAATKGVFGGEFIMKKLNFLERMIVKKVANITSDTSMVSEQAIAEFSQTMFAA